MKSLNIALIIRTLESESVEDTCGKSPYNPESLLRLTLKIFTTMFNKAIIDIMWIETVMHSQKSTIYN